MSDQLTEPDMTLPSVVDRLGRKAAAYQAIIHSGFISWLQRCQPGPCSLTDWWMHFRFVKDWRLVADHDVIAVLDYYLKLGIDFMAMAVAELNVDALRTDFLVYQKTSTEQSETRSHQQELDVARWFVSAFYRTELRERLTFLNDHYFLEADILAVYQPQAVALIDRVLIPLLVKLLVIQPDCQPFVEGASGQAWLNQIFWVAAGCDNRKVDELAFYKNTSLSTARELAAITDYEVTS